ncbi:hypothetical protein GCM10023405_16990 [Streptomonospora salina]
MGPAGLTRASDLYSLGVVLRELLSGGFDYSSYSTTTVVDSLTKGQSPLRETDLSLPPWVCRGLRRIVSKATHPNPDFRYQTAREMSTQIARVKTADWHEVSPSTWEAQHLRDAHVTIQVRAEPISDGVRISTRKRKNVSWRRAAADATAASLDHPDVRAVFERANNLAVN